MGNLDTTNMRIHWLRYDTFLNIKVATSATTEVLKGLIEAQSGVPASEQRLICNQCELLPRTTLEEQSLKTNSVATLLEQPEERVCPEWLATGRCHMKGCCLRATHTMEYSPRYLAHHIKQSKRVKQNQDPAAIPRPPSPPELEMHYAPSARPRLRYFKGLLPAQSNPSLCSPLQLFHLWPGRRRPLCPKTCLQQPHLSLHRDQ